MQTDSNARQQVLPALNVRDERLHFIGCCD